MAWYNGTTRTVELTSQTAVWYRSGNPAVTIRWVLIRDPQGAFTPQALLCTDPTADPPQILERFVLRCQLAVTFQEARTHLGVETQRQWSDLVIARTTPILLGLFSWTTLAAHALQQHHPITQRTAAWYDKPSPTFVEAIALARRRLWLVSEGFSLSGVSTDTQELPVTLYHRVVDSERGMYRLDLGINPWNLPEPDYGILRVLKPSQSRVFGLKITDRAPSEMRFINMTKSIHTFQE